MPCCEWLGKSAATVIAEPAKAIAICGAIGRIPVGPASVISYRFVLIGKSRYGWLLINLEAATYCVSRLVKFTNLIAP